MDGHAFGKLPGRWTRRTLWIAAAVAGTALVAWNYYFFEQLFAAVILYSAVTIPILMLVFVLVLAEEAGMQGLTRVGRRFPLLHHGLDVPLARPLGKQGPAPIRPLAFGPRLIREFHKVSRTGFHLPTRRRAA